MTTTTAPARDLPRVVFTVLCLGLLLGACLWILQPFLPAIVWSTLIVVATWRLLGRAQRFFGGRRWVAVTTLTALLVALFLAPVAVAIAILVANGSRIAAWLRTLPDVAFQGPPGWIESIPLIGSAVADGWRDLVARGPDGIATNLAPYADQIARWFAARIGGVGGLLFDLVLTLVAVGVLYARGERIGATVRQFAHHLAGARGEDAVLLAATATRAVAFGVVVTALIQAIVGGLGLVVAGIPAWPILTAAMFLSSIAQLGAAPIVGAAALWLFLQGHTGWGIFLAAWALVVGSLDNVIRPLLIGREARLSFLMVFAGVIGGLVAFGPVGLFAGPVVLAVTGSLLGAWMRGDRLEPEGEPTEV